MAQSVAMNSRTIANFLHLTPRGRDTDDFEVRFFDHLRAEFDACCTDEKVSDSFRKRGQEIIKKLEDPDQPIMLGDLYDLELVVLQMQSTETLKERLPGLMFKYKELGGTISQEEMDHARQEADPEHLRALLQRFLRFLHWGYEFSPIREKWRALLIRRAVFFMLIATPVWALIVWWLRQLDGKQFIAIATTVVFAGMLGGMISCMRRVGQIPTDGDPVTAIQSLKNSRYALVFAPVVGGVSAVVLMLGFLSGTLEGALFPAFNQQIDIPKAGQWTFLFQLLPMTPADYGKLFLWSFIAGFAEKLVPDSLDAIIRKGQLRSGKRAEAETAAAEAEPAK